MTYTQDDHAILSLMVRLPRQQDTGVPPLDLREYNQLVTVLLEPLKTTPAGLYSEEIRHAVEERLLSMTAERIHALTEDRRHTIALLLEQMESMGITVVTRRMESYPRYLREKLGAAAPPYLYICGAGEIADSLQISGSIGWNSPEDSHRPDLLSASQTVPRRVSRNSRVDTTNGVAGKCLVFPVTR